MSEDITYCTAECANKDTCERNPSRIKETWHPHSYSDFSEGCMGYSERRGMTKDEAKQVLRNFMDGEKVHRSEVLDAFLIAGMDAKMYEMCKMDSVPETIDMELVDIYNELSDRIDRAAPQINKEN